MGPYKPLRTWVDEFIPYYMEIMGVDQPDRTYTIERWDLTSQENNFTLQPRVSKLKKLTAKAPGNGWLEYDRFLLGPGLFSGATC